MSVRVQSKVWEHSRASGNTLIVLLKIADSCDDDGRNAWPSIKRLARYCRCSESTVHRAIAELRELGELEVILNGGGGPRTASRYAPNLYRVVVEGYQDDTPATPPGVSFSCSRGVKPGDSGVSPVTPNSSLESSLNRGSHGNEALAAEHLALSRALLRRAPRREDDEVGDPRAAHSASVSSRWRISSPSRVDPGAVNTTSRREPSA